MWGTHVNAEAFTDGLHGQRGHKATNVQHQRNGGNVVLGKQKDAELTSSDYSENNEVIDRLFEIHTISLP